MTTDRKIKFASDLCTFYNPAYWGHEGGYASIGDLFSWGTWNELSLWNRVLDSVQEAGLDGIEITFAPGDWTSALAAYGSAEGFACFANFVIPVGPCSSSMGRLIRSPS